MQTEEKKIEKVVPLMFSVYDEETGTLFDVHSIDQNGQPYPENEWEIVVSGFQRPGNVVNVRDFSPMFQEHYEEVCRMAEFVKEIGYDALEPHLYFDEGVPGE